MSTDVLKKFDAWLAEDGPAALVLREYLMPVEGKDAPVFPATFAATEDGEFKGGYNIDRFDGGRNVCLIDSVGAQANRMEPLFKREKYKSLVPQIEIKAGDHTINLLDAGHRAADAIVRFSSLNAELQRAFRAIADRGDAEPLAKIAPTSLLFGVWDSRATEVKLPRLLSSVIRAYDVNEHHRSAQYVPPLRYKNSVLADVADKVEAKGSEDGFVEVPSSWKLGGVDVRGQIRRDATLSLVGIRNLSASNPAKTEALRRHILGLGLVALTAPRTHDLRQGCLLVRDPDRKMESQIVRHDGTREPLSLEPQAALDYAAQTASHFGVGENRSGNRAVSFDVGAAKGALNETKEQKKANKRAAKG